MLNTKRLHLVLALTIAFLSFTSQDALAAKPLKVYILAGQSNMEGHAEIRTIGYAGDDAETAHLLEMMTDANGDPVVADRAWVSNLNGFFDNNGVKTGKLAAGFGARRNPTELGNKVGPEYTFGLTMQAAYDGPILIIKTAWGGKSLHTDFRSPSAGPYTLSDWQKENYPKQEGHGIPKDFAQWKLDKAKATGVYYKMMIEHVNAVLADPGKVVPNYDKEAGYEVAGFVWFQAWNDWVDSHTYPHNLGEKRFDAYSTFMSHFINDVRKEVKAPDMPFVIGVMGVDGPVAPDAKNQSMNHFRKAMAAPSKTMKHVYAVETAPMWDKKLGEIDRNRNKVRQMAYFLKVKHKDHANADGSMSDADQKAYLKKYEEKMIPLGDQAIWARGASNAGYHYMGSGKMIAQFGEAFAKALLEAE
ncbi:MAG: sialate O-acetylesterase [Phycisphaeraceae bacterium]